MNNIETNKQIAVAFLQSVIAGRIDEAYSEHAAADGKHHNAYFKAGFAALAQGMKDNHAKFPNKNYDVKHVLGDGDLVAVHGVVNLSPEGPNIIVVHLFRFAGGKIVEMWDVGQPLTPDSPNADGQY